MTGVWLDPPKAPQHRCQDEFPTIFARDAGRRWQCSCGTVYVVDVLGPGREQGEPYFRRVEEPQEPMAPPWQRYTGENPHQRHARVTSVEPDWDTDPNPAPLNVVENRTLEQRRADGDA